MRARMRPADILSKDQKDAIRQYTKEELTRQAQGNVRRLFKLMCLSFHEEFGFGRERCSRIIKRINALAEEHEEDEVYWAHVDLVMKQMGIPFDAENYDEVDR